MLNMHRPSDQAKLLFFALLRSTVSALATTEHKVAAGAVNNLARNHVTTTTATTSATTSFEQQFPNIQLRLARRADVPSIQRCNLATLPENYNSQFYVNHMRQWPDLCLVAEDTMSNNNNNGDYNNNHQDRPFGGAFPSLGGYGIGNMASGGRSPNVVAYVLGKVEEKPRRIPPRYYTEGYQLDHNNNDGSWNQEQEEKERFMGHVTSLAVLQPYRRQGLAAALMKQLHFHLEEAHGAGAVGLHVRKSNQAACRLYQEYGYQIDLTIPAYYQDGEDAYFMKKPLALLSEPEHAHHQQQHQAPAPPPAPKFPFFTAGRRPQKPWEMGPMDLRLPRDMVPEVNNGASNSNAAAAGAGIRVDEQSSGLLTGSM